MSRLFAIGDLHLSGSGRKPMDVFGPLWRDHAERMARAWDERVADEDTVLLVGDLSWARSLAEAEVDLRWIAERPGRKLLLRGNHDSWWSSATRVRAALPDRCEILQNSALEFEEWVVVGARGWTAPDDPHAMPGDGRIFRRELDRLRASIREATRLFDRRRPRLAMLHFPPWIDGRDPTEVVDVLLEASVRICIYGHLHGEDHRLAVTGWHRGMRYCFVAADAIGFAPVAIDLAREPEDEGDDEVRSGHERARPGGS